ncbi:tol-pal system protein YbgF [Methylovulum psychrotolerans]|uniref:tol-pal system protein YbgF n=1 Tax=Methylovulum psychrotolerans TaxID=1704499 RepID=UPI001BFF486A|nr:tol-pal system protein YbgF [Methylovulum psychrotolerans]MBT9099835.1 tol-pal system protein YbgF [Methylovulum psychrotolerans]
MNKRLVILLAAYCGLNSPVQALPEVIDNSAYPPSAAAAANNIAPSPSTSSLMEMTGRLEQLQTEVQQLTGKVEEQANTIAELKKQQKARLGDVEDRLQSLEGKGTSGASADTPAPVSEALASDASAPAPAAEPASPRAADTPRTPIDATPPAAAPVPAAPVAKTPAPVVSDTENAAYKSAYLALRSGHTDDAISGFNNYLTTYPNSGLAGNAQYWLGEAYLVKKDPTAAKQAFSNVGKNYPNSAKQADALYMLGKIELDQNHPDKARDYLTQVTSQYPNTTAARAATKKLLTLNISQ